MKWIKKLLGLCEHNFVDIATYNVERYSYIKQSKDVVAIEYHQKCSKCSKIRKYRL